jgi:AraC-like DNA-binding protein
MVDSPLAWIEKTATYRAVRTRRRLVMPLAKLRPLVRLAHRISGPLLVPCRMIFDFELVLVVAGRSELVLSSGPVPLESGQVVLIPPFVPHSFARPSDRCEHVAVHFDFSPDIPGGNTRLWRRRPYELRIEDAPELPAAQAMPGAAVQPLLLEVIRLLARKTPLSQAEASVRLADALLRLMRLQSPEPDDASNSPARAKIARAMAFIDAHLTAPLSAEDLAAASGLSPSHFNRLFNQHTGHSPMEYVRRRRVAEARKLLADVDLSIKEIARRCGFDDAFHFSKVFRSIEGIPPARYRRGLVEMPS